MFSGSRPKTTSRVHGQQTRSQPEIRHPALAAWEKLSSRPYGAGRQLPASPDPSGTGLLIDGVSTAFSGDVACTVERFTHTHSPLVIVANSRCEGVAERLIVRTLSQRTVSGSVVLSRSDHAQPVVERTPGLYAVCLDRPAGGLDAAVAEPGAHPDLHAPARRLTVPCLGNMRRRPASGRTA